MTQETTEDFVARSPYHPRQVSVFMLDDQFERLALGTPQMGPAWKKLLESNATYVTDLSNDFYLEREIKAIPRFGFNEMYGKVISMLAMRTHAACKKGFKNFGEGQGDDGWLFRMIIVEPDPTFTSVVDAWHFTVFGIGSFFGPEARASKEEPVIRTDKFSCDITFRSKVQHLGMSYNEDGSNPIADLALECLRGINTAGVSATSFDNNPITAYAGRVAQSNHAVLKDAGLLEEDVPRSDENGPLLNQ